MTDEIRSLIRERIEALGLSQAEVARRMGVQPQELNRALQDRGKVAPIWEKILDFFTLELTVVPADHNNPDSSSPMPGSERIRECSVGDNFTFSRSWRAKSLD